MDSVNFVFLCNKPPLTHQDWLEKIKEKKIDGANYYISDSVYKLYSKQIDAYINEYPTHFILSPELKIMGYDVEGFNTDISVVYQISASLKGMRSSKAFKQMARKLLRGEKGKPVSKEFANWYKTIYGKNIDSLIAATKKRGINITHITLST